MRFSAFNIPGNKTLLESKHLGGGRPMPSSSHSGVTGLTVSLHQRKGRVLVFGEGHQRAMRGDE